MHPETAYVSVFMTFNSVCCFAVEDEESTIEEQEATEVAADQKAELAKLTKEGEFALLSGHHYVGNRSYCIC